MLTRIVLLLLVLTCIASAQVTLDHVAPNRVWGSVTTKVHVAGTGFDKTKYDIAVTLCDTPCEIIADSVAETGFDCMTAVNTVSHDWCDVSVVLTSVTDASNVITADLPNKFRFYNPLFQHVIPRSIASSSGAEVRLALRDLIPASIEPLTVTLAGVPAEIVTQTDYFITVKAGIVETAPEDDTIVVSTKSGIPVFTARMAFNYYDTTANDPYVSQVSPSWVTHSLEKQMLTVRGPGIAATTSIRYIDPDNRFGGACDIVSVVEDTDTVMCTLPPLRFAYMGPLALQAYRGEAVVAVFEVQVVAAPKMNFIVPAASMPANHDTTVRFYIEDFPYNVPVAIGFTPLFTITADKYTLHKDGVSFALPRCTAENDCHAPYSGDIYLTNAVDGDVIVALGAFTYTAPAEGMAVTSVYPPQGYFEDDKYYNVYGYGFTMGEVPVTSVELRRVNADKQQQAPLAASLEVRDSSTISIRVPEACFAPHACRNGDYAVVLLDKDGKQLNTNAAPITLALRNNDAPAVMYRMRLLEPYDAAQETAVLQRVDDALTDALTLEPNRVWGIRTEKAVLKASGLFGVEDERRSLELNAVNPRLLAMRRLLQVPVNHVVNASALGDAGATNVYVVIRPLVDDEEPTPTQIALLFDALVADEESSLYVALPTLDRAADATAHTSVQWCERKGAYASSCGGNGGNISDAVKVAIVILAVAVVASVAVAMYVRRKRQEARAIGLLDEHAAVYSQLN